MILNEIQPEDLKGDFYKIRYDKTCGAVYVAGYTSGTVKIGSTAHPMNRFMQLKYSSVEYAGGELEKFALSNPVREYTKLEKDIHKRFEGECIRKELFGIDFKQAVKIINSEFQNFDKLNIKSDREFKSLQRFNEIEAARAAGQASGNGTAPTSGGEEGDGQRQEPGGSGEEGGEGDHTALSRAVERGPHREDPGKCRARKAETA